MDYFVLKENILLWCSQRSILTTTNITKQIFLFDGLAWKHASTQIVFTAITIRLNEKYFLLCYQAWKHYPVYTISQTKCTTSIFVWRTALKSWWFHADCHHSNYQMLKQNVLPYIISHKCTTNIFVWWSGFKTLFHED